MFVPILLSVIIVSLISLIGVVLFSFNQKFVRKALLFFVSFAAGAMLGDVFIHILPELSEDAGEGFSSTLLIVLFGVLATFVIEKIIHWRHCHVLDDHDHVHPVGPITLIGDALHNMVDGVLIAASYLVNMEVGIATTVAVILHEIPQEIGDFSILLHSGYTAKRAVFFNFLSACAAIIGALIVLVFTQYAEGIETPLIAFTAGNLLYIAGSDLIPELHKESKAGHALLQLLCMIAGICVMYALTILE